MPEPADARLIERLKGGDEDALASIYDRFCTRLYRTAIGLCASRDDAEDVVHDTFLGLWNARTTIAQIEDLTAYLFASLRYAAVRQRKRDKRQRMIIEEIEQRAMRARSVTEQPSAMDDIQELLQSLPIEQREVLVMKVYGGLTFGEVAAALDISANTAASRYRYALEKLRDRLTAEKAQHE